MRIDRALPTLLLLSRLLCSFSLPPEGEQHDHYSILGIPRSSLQQEVKRAYHQLSLKWHPDKWFSEGGAFEGMEKEEVTEDDASQARAHFYRISSAYEVLADEEQRRVYDESREEFNPEAQSLKEKVGESWSEGCQNSFSGCRDVSILHEQLNRDESFFFIGKFGNALSCLMECERQRECHAYIFFGLKTEDGERAGRCFGKMWRAGERIEWLPRAYLHATCGFVPSTASKYSQSKFGRTSLLWLLRTAVERMISSSFWAISELSSHPQILGGIVATLLTLAWLLHYIKTRREEEMKRVEQKREEYRQAELRRIREEVSERERQKELSKQLKRELWEAEKLEEERKKKEIEANEILLRERMQNKYNHLEQKKRTAREQKKKEEEEKKRKQQEEELKRRLPALYKEAARGICEEEEEASSGRRLGGEQGSGDSAENARMASVRAAAQRLDAAVSSGEIPDAETRRKEAEARKAAERVEKLRQDRERAEKALPSVLKTGGETLTADAGAEKEGEEETPAPSSSQKPSFLLDPTGRYAGGAAAAAAERRQNAALSSGELEANKTRYEEEKIEREHREIVEKEQREASRRDFEKKNLPAVWKDAAASNVLGSSDSNDAPRLRSIVFRSSNAAVPETRMELDTSLSVEETKVKVSSKLADNKIACRGEDIRLVFSGRVLKNEERLEQVLKSASSKIKQDSSVVFHMVISKFDK